MITQRTLGDVVVLVPRIREDEDARVLVDLATGLASDGARHLVVNLSDVGTHDGDFFDDVSGAMGAVWACYHRLGGRVVVSNLRRGMRWWFHGTRMDQVIEIYDTEAEAIASFGEG